MRDHDLRSILGAVFRAAVRPSGRPVGPNLWRRELLLAAVVLPSAVSFAANAVGARMFGLRLFGLWVFWRSAIQLTANVTPGFNVGVTVLLPRFQKSGDHDRLEESQWVADRAALVWVAAALCVVIPVAFGLIDQSADIVWALVALWAGTFFSGYTESVARGRRDGAAVLAGSVANVFGGALCILAAFVGSFSSFVWIQALRWWIRGLVQYRRPRPDGGGPPWADIRGHLSRLVKVGFPLTVRGWVQSAAQYGDRLVIGGVFGAAVVGAAGLGSMLALPSVMLASTAGAWLLPILIAGGTEEAETAFEYEILTIGIAVVGGALLLPLYPYVVPEAAPDMELLVLAYLVVCQLSLLVPVLTPMIAAGNIWRAAGLHGLSVGAIAVTIIGTATIGFPPGASLSLAVAVGFLTVGAVVLVSPIGQFQVSPVMLATTVVLASLGLIGFSGVSGEISENPVLAVPLGAVGAALGIVAAWRVFSRPSLQSGSGAGDAVTRQPTRTESATFDPEDEERS